jgi:WD40 repeat protein
MGKSGQQLDQLMELIAENGSANLARVLRTLYPGEQRQRALASVRQLRLDVQKAADKAGVSLRLSGDNKTRTPAEERLVWFDGDDQLVEAAERWVEPNLDGPNRYAQDAIKLGPVRLYVVYADEDEADAKRLLEALQPHLQVAGIVAWTHTDILPGESPETERARSRQGCDLTLQFISPRFEAAGLKDERTARVVPVLLHRLARERDDVEVFRYRGKSFDKSNARDFARELFLKITAVLTQHPQALEEELRALAQHEGKFIENPASPVSLRRDADLKQPVTNRCDALTFLDQWLMDPRAPRYCALLGELGMGKTTTAKEFARRLGECRRQGKGGPIPIFLDLRYVGDFATRDPDLDQIVGRILKQSWKGGTRSKPPNVTEIYQLVEQGAVVIFDGLDEVLVHLTPSQGRAFTRQLFRMVPPGANQGRLLVTCRTHYFRTFQEQSAHFTLEDRDSVSAESYRALVLLPFGEGQIRTYLKNSLPNRDADHAYAFIKSVHNLPELAERPYTLSLIARQFARLEEWKASARTVTGLTLYRFVVEEWLLRDGGKHQLNPEHKQMLMEYVAAELVRSAERTWSAAKLEQWLMDFLGSNHGIASHYEGVKRDLLKEDLRTATFLVRDETNDQFRFAHSSLQEYFLACYLRRSLEESAFMRWALPGVSQETLDFLGQSLQEQPSDRGRKGLVSLRDAYRPLASELAFRYVLLAQSKGYPAPPAAGFQLPGADLFGLETDHTGEGMFDLSGLNLKGARIANTFWGRCRFSGSDFSSADAERGEWQHCDLSGSLWHDAELEGALFRRCVLTDAEFSNTRTYRTKWLRCLGVGVANQPQISPESSKLQLQVGHSDTVNACAWSPDCRHVLSASNDNTLKIWDAASGDCLLTLSGHSSFVNGCTWSPDGRRLLSASNDNTLKIWDAISGDCLLTLSGHSSSVHGCAWSPDGHRVLSVCWDSSLKIWDAASGDCLLTFYGHSKSVRSCGWSPDGQCVLSGSWDNTMKIWDAASGRCLLTLSGHSDSVTGCAWSPDGRRVLSASMDGTLKIWDAVLGDCSLTISGHSSPVYDCSWSPDGRRLLSVSQDPRFMTIGAVVKIWDALSGDCQLILSCDSGRNCAWSPDGKRVLCASETLQIWDATSGVPLLNLSRESSFVVRCAWSHRGDRLLSASGDNTVRIWDASSGGCLFTLSGHSSTVLACGWSPNDERVLSASGDAFLKIWEAASGRCLLTLSGHSGPVWGCAWSPEGGRVVSASLDKTLKIWSVMSGECLHTLYGHAGPVWSCAWSSDGGRVLSASKDRTLKIWDSASGACVLTLSGHSSSVRSCAWSPDGDRILSASGDATLKIWDVFSGDCLLTLSGHSSTVAGCAWSPDGTRVLSASFDKTLKIWDAASGDCQLTFSGHSSVRDCAWSPDGRRVLAAFDSGAVSQFDAATLAETGPRCYHLKSPHSEPTWATVDPVQNRVLSYGEGAWRSVGYAIPGETGMPTWLSVEAFADNPRG